MKQLSLENLTEHLSHKFLNYSRINDVEKLNDLLDPPWITDHEPFLELSGINLSPALESMPILQSKPPLAIDNQDTRRISRTLVQNITNWTSSNHSPWLSAPSNLVDILVGII